ncbi:MAG: hypothetical protein NT178_02710 [Proteobacteria bacterium]|nr:hypothetical protein [Pseudomonadota bacterium]
MILYFHLDEYKMSIIRVLAVVCGIFLLAACSASRTENKCVNTKKENNDMTSEMGSPGRNVLPLNTEIPMPAGQETAIFGMG